MNKSKFILLMSLICTTASVCWGQSYWKRMYEEAGGDYVYAIAPISDGNFIVAGSTILKITQYGDTLWTKANNGTTHAIAPIPDGNFFLASDKILKITPDGDILWTKTYGKNSTGACAIVPTQDGNFIIVGQIDTLGVGFGNIFVFKITSNGDTLWSKILGRSNTAENNRVSAITPTPDGNFIIAGTTSSLSTMYDVYLFKINPMGERLWTKTYGGASVDEAYAITPTLDGNFLVAGNTSSFNNGPEVSYLVKINTKGDTLWTKTFVVNDNDDFAIALSPTSDGNFIVIGMDGCVAYILKIRPNGDPMWTKTFGEKCDFMPSAITATPDGNFIIAGNGYTSDNYYVWLRSIINDRYAYKNSLFTFKIPVSGDSLNQGYMPLKVPSGMKVSLGGTISWTPTTNSVYMDHAEFLVFDDIGNKDTLTFNIFVNSSYHPAALKPISHLIANKNRSFSINQTLLSQIKFNLPNGTSSLEIYDINGRCVQRLKPVDAQAIWNGLNIAGRPVSSGRYFAKIKEGTSSRLAEFSVVK